MIKFSKLKLSSIKAAYSLSVFSFIFNLPLFSYYLDSNPINSLESIIHLLTFIGFVFCLINIVHIVIVHYKIDRIVVSTLLLLNTIGLYFVKNFHIIIDKNMIRNLFETDFRESFEYLNLTFLLYIISLGLVPLIFYFRVVRIIPKSPSIELFIKLKHIGINLFFIIILFFSSNKLFTSYLRSHREIKHILFPINYISASLAQVRFLKKTEEIKEIKNSTKLSSKWKKIKNRTVMVIILGETARSKNFSINGYIKDTNPLMSKQNDLISFQDVESCGTSTAESLPCMFSHKTKTEFDPSVYSENLLDVVQQSGFKVVWIDNNSGCKGVCDRVKFIPMQGYDDEMVNHLPSILNSLDDDKILIVLHQLGSHGPSYHKRYPEEAEKFKPSCKTDQLYNCSESEVANSYDNTIIMTDKLIDSTIKTLRKINGGNSILLYISDHGESLGENGLYLHGLPFWLAPREQKHIPMIFWSSIEYREMFGLDYKCLQKKYKDKFSHDNFFHSVLGVLHIENNFYDKQYDIFNGCYY